MIRTFGVHTDISHMKMHGTPILSLIGMNGEPSSYDIKVDNQFNINTTGLTRRETEILKLLAAGKSSNEISAQCFISVHTVNTHRKNLLGKTGCTNTVDLISHALRMGWI